MRPVRLMMLVAASLLLVVALSLPAAAATSGPSQRPSPPPRDLPAQVDTSPDRLRYITTAASVAALAVLAIAAAVVSGRTHEDQPGDR